MTQAKNDNSHVQRFTSSRKLTFLYLLLGLAMTGLSLWALAASYSERPVDWVLVALGASGTLLFGAATLEFARRFRTPNHAFIELRPEGIYDPRVAARTIPWEAVTGVSIWSARGRSFVVVNIDSAIEETLDLTKTARLSRGPNRLLGIDGLILNPVGLPVKAHTLQDLIVERLEEFYKEPSRQSAL
ncbi:hypothetical protein GCM10011316_39730 [Roseibium aquae]|uniref:PH domain-containing protein n=1 Tax=Roseibium aquae TaxID=1323746 RepID=A0A916X2I9_9HYPH|nr:STM3941 family protein [Roseibium aquae]GGB63964.1 hypothetical protein GCM10011316_39730 [Roseibium aquae]